jgi:hypothetical protein
MNELPELFDDYYGTENEDDVPIYESDAYWQFNEMVNQVEGEEFFYDLSHSKLNDANTKFLVTGYIGWYNKNHRIKPYVMEGIEQAVETCLDQSDICEIEFKDGSIIVHAHHHDGCNWFEVRRLTEKGANEAEKAASRIRMTKIPTDWLAPLQLDEIGIRL